MQMDLCSKGNGGMVSLMGKVLFTFLMDRSTQAVGKMESMTAMEFTNQNPKLRMMGCGHWVCIMDKAHLHGQMALITLGIGSIAKRRGLESTWVLMGRLMKGIG